MARSAKNEKKLTIEEKLEQALVPEAEQPYPVPRNWCWTKVGVLSSHHRGVSYRKGDAHSNKQPNDCLILRGGNIGEGFLSIDEDNVYVDKAFVSKEQVVRANDIIIVTSTGSEKVIGRAGIATSDYADVAFGAFLMLVRPKNSVNARYVGYYFLSDLYRNRIRKMAAGVNINNIRANFISESPLPLPPLAEQQRIVHRIESLFSKLDAAKEKAQAVVDGYEDCRAAILHKAFTGELTAEWRKKHSKHMKEWRQYKYGELGDSKLGKMLDKDKNTGKLIPYLRNINVRWFDFDLSDVLSMRASDQEIKALQVRKGDLFICEGGEPGRCAIWQDEDANIIFQKALHRFRPHEKVLSEYMCYYLYYLNLNNKLEKYFTGTTIKHLTGKALSEIPISMPEIEEQKALIRLLEQSLGKEEECISLSKEVINRIDSIKQSILARVFRGELGTNVSEEGSAIELVKACLSQV